MKSKRIILKLSLLTVLLVLAWIAFVLFKNSDKKDIEFRIHINDELIHQSTFGEPPTFAIWLQKPGNDYVQTIFVTKRAAMGDWEGKAEVPVALPKWFEVYKKENQANSIPSLEKPAPLAITGATPKAGYFTTRVRVPRGSDWDCFIEMNLAGDFNEQYPQYNEQKKTSDEFMTGQPALLYHLKLNTTENSTQEPKLIGMTLPASSENEAIVHPITGITSAKNVFDEIEIAVVDPKLRLIEQQKK